MFEVDLGKIKFKWRGTYDATADYEVDDVVKYGNDNFICTASNGVSSGVATPSTTSQPFWDLMTQGTSAPAGTPADGDIIVYDGTNAQQEYQKPTGLIGIHEHTFTKLGRWNNGSALGAIGTYYKFPQVYDDTNNWVSQDTFLQDAIDKTANDHQYPWCVFSPLASDTSRKVEMLYWVGHNDVSTHVHFQVWRYCIEDSTDVRAMAINPWAASVTAPDADFNYYTYSSNGATHQYSNHPVSFNFVDSTPLDPTKHYYYHVAVEGSASCTAYINYNANYYSYTYGGVQVSNTIITEFRNPS